MGLRCARPWEIIWIWTTLQLESIAWKCFWWGIRGWGRTCRVFFRLPFSWAWSASHCRGGVSRRFARSWGRERSGTNAKDLTQGPQRQQRHGIYRRDAEYAEKARRGGKHFAGGRDLGRRRCAPAPINPLKYVQKAGSAIISPSKLWISIT